MSRLNYYQAATSAEKLRGAYYTPPDLVRLILREVDLRPGDRVLDPSCGDGEFLVNALHHLADAGAPAEGVACSLYGLDINLEAVRLARERLRTAYRERFRSELREAELRILPRSGLDCPTRESLETLLSGVGEGRLLVLGNPPYVEAKRLSAAAKAELARAYPEAASGAPDLYLYFLHAALGWLREEDLLALVLPNKVTVNSAALRLRDRLLASRQLRGIDFATQAGLFEGAAVYPIVLYAGAARPTAAAVRLGRVEAAANGLQRRDLPAVNSDDYALTAARALFPTPDSAPLRDALLHLVRQVPEGRLDDVLDIRWAVSFHRQGLRERYVTPGRPASPHARPMLGGGAFSGNGEVARYTLRWGGWWIDYDADRLRQEGNSLPDPAMFAQPKVVICQNGRTLRAAYDNAGYVLKDTFLCGLPRSRHPLAMHPRALVGLLCSRAAHFFYSHVFYGGHVNGGYLHFLRSFLADVPLGSWSATEAAAAAELVERREQETDEVRSRQLEDELEEHVSTAYGLTPELREEIRRWCEEDANWTARARIRPVKSVAG